MASHLHHLDLDEDVGNARPGVTKFITIPRTVVGKLIGKGGTTIKSLQSKSGARIKIVDCQVTITGEVAKVKRAETLIWELVGDLRLKTITIGQTQIGLLIGAKGAQIRSIQEKSGATVKINPQAGGANADAIVDVTGTEAQIHLAEQLIAKAISKADPIVEMSTSSGKSGSKLVLKQLDHGVKEQDLLNVYPDTHIRPKIVIRVESSGVTNYATLSFTTKGEMEIWMNQLNGQILYGRRITLKKK